MSSRSAWCASSTSASSATSTTEQRARWFDGAAGLAAPLFESLDTGAQSPRNQASHAVLHGLYWLTANLASEGALALAVDDVHWADPPSLRFLAYLGNRVDELPVFVAVGARPSEPGAEVALLEELAAGPATRTLRPARLSAEAVAQLVDSAFGGRQDEALAAACFEASAGNPLLVHELLITLQADEGAPTAIRAEGVREVVPSAVARSVARRLRPLPPEAQVLARAVAVLGDGADLGLAARLAELEHGFAVELADALVRVDVLDDGLEFVHPVVRAAIYSELSAAERAQQHRAAAALLAEADAGEDEIAIQLLAGQASGDGWVVDVLRRAARTARARGAPEIAVAYLRRATSEPPPVEARFAVLVELGLAEMAAGEPSGIASLREAHELAKGPRGRAAVSLELGRALTQMASFAEAAEVFEAAVAELGDDDPELRQRLEGQLLTACMPVPAMVPRVLGLLGPLMMDSSQVSDPVVLACVAARDVGVDRAGPGGCRRGRTRPRGRIVDRGRAVRLHLCGRHALGRRPARSGACGLGWRGRGGTQARIAPRRGHGLALSCLRGGPPGRPAGGGGGRPRGPGDPPRGRGARAPRWCSPR